MYGATDEQAPPERELRTFISASDARFRYEGRFDQHDPESVGVIWQGSRITLSFEGETLGLKFTQVKGQNFFNAEIDGRTRVVAVREGVAPRGIEFTDLGRGRHRLVLFKRSEAAAGTTHFAGVSLSPSGMAQATAKPAAKIALQFFGDSITAGACNEDGAEDQWEDYSTHNNARSYGAFVAEAFGADYRNIAVSGMGISIGWVPMKADQIWDRVYPTADSPRADLTTWTPHVVFVNLGENDDSFTKANSLPFPADFAPRYVALVRAMRDAFPKAHIVILRGGMFGGARSERLRQAWEAAVRELESTDAHLSHFVFEQWSPHHPRVADHRAMADELIAWLRKQPFMSAPK